jgi:hypothetical protein
MSVASFISALAPESVLKPLGLDRVKVISSIRRLVYSRQYAPDRARWSGLWVDRLMQLEAAGIEYPCGPMSSPAGEPLTKHEYDRIARVLRDVEDALLEGTRWDLNSQRRTL